MSNYSFISQTVKYIKRSVPSALTQSPNERSIELLVSIFFHNHTVVTSLKGKNTQPRPEKCFEVFILDLEGIHRACSA